MLYNGIRFGGTTGTVSLRRGFFIGDTSLIGEAHFGGGDGDLSGIGDEDRFFGDVVLLGSGNTSTSESSDADDKYSKVSLRCKLLFSILNYSTINKSATI